jgi:hypothetical protein
MRYDGRSMRLCRARSCGRAPSPPARKAYAHAGEVGVVDEAILPLLLRHGYQHRGSEALAVHHITRPCL